MHVISCLDVFPEKVVEEIKSFWGNPLEPCFATTYNRSEQMDLASKADYLVAGVAPIDAEMMKASPHLKAILKWGIGVDKIDLEEARKRKIKVLITAGLNAVPVAEHAVLLMLAASKRIPYLDGAVREGRWLKAQPETRNFAYHLQGRRVGIVGFGNIGKRVARLVKAFEADVCYYDIYRQSAEVEEELGVTYKTFEELLIQSDILTLHAPLTSDNSHLIDATALAKMPQGALLINTARGGLVDEIALYNSLKNGHLAAAGLDVFNEEPLSENSLLLSLPNVVLTPHIAGATFNNVGNSAKHIRDNIERMLKKELLPQKDIVVG